MTINATAADPARALRRGGAAAGRRAREAVRHHPERHPEGVHRARDVHLPARRRRCGSSPTSSRSAGEHVPRWNTISISGYHMREAGCTAVQEVAFTLANGDRLRAGRASTAGLDVDDFAPQLSFFFNAHNNLVEEVAKFRAARRLWARLMRERFGARDPRSLTLRFHAQTAGSTLTAQQPENNVVRVTVQALAAVLGGCQSLHTNSMDEALALPTERAVRHRAAHAADPRPRVGRRRHRRSARRLLRGRARSRATSRARPEAYITQHRRPGRLGGRHRLHAARDPGRRLPLPARGRGQGADRGRRQRLRHRRGAAGQPVPGRRRAWARRSRERVARVRASRDGDRAARALDALEAGARGREQPDAAASSRPSTPSVTLGEICERLRARVRRAPAVGDVLSASGARWPSLLACSPTLRGGPAGGRHGRSGRRPPSRSMAGDFVKAFQPVEAHRGLRWTGREIFLDVDAGARRPGRPGVHDLPQGRRRSTIPLTGKPLGRYEEVLGHAQVRRVYPSSRRRPSCPLPETAARRGPRTAPASRAAACKVAVTPVLDLTPDRRRPAARAVPHRDRARALQALPGRRSAGRERHVRRAARCASRRCWPGPSARCAWPATWRSRAGSCPSCSSVAGSSYLDMTYISAITGTALFSRRAARGDRQRHRGAAFPVGAPGRGLRAAVLW